MKIKRTSKGSTEWLAREPISVLAADGVTVDHVETTWTDDEAAALDFTARVPTAQHARDIAAQLAGMGCEFPPGWNNRPEPAAKKPATPGPSPALKVERHDTADGIALRARLAAGAAPPDQAPDIMPPPPRRNDRLN